MYTFRPCSCGENLEYSYVVYGTETGFHETSGPLLGTSSDYSFSFFQSVSTLKAAGLYAERVLPDLILILTKFAFILSIKPVHTYLFLSQLNRPLA